MIEDTQRDVLEEFVRADRANRELDWTLGATPEVRVVEHRRSVALLALVAGFPCAHCGAGGSCSRHTPYVDALWSLPGDPLHLHAARRAAINAALREHGARTVCL